MPQLCRDPHPLPQRPAAQVGLHGEPRRQFQWRILPCPPDTTPTGGELAPKNLLGYVCARGPIRNSAFLAQDAIKDFARLFDISSTVFEDLEKLV